MCELMNSTKWKLRLGYHVQSAYARLLSMDRQLLPSWKEYFLAFDRFQNDEPDTMRVYVTMIDSCMNNEEFHTATFFKLLDEGCTEEAQATGTSEAVCRQGLIADMT